MVILSFSTRNFLFPLTSLISSLPQHSLIRCLRDNLIKILQIIQAQWTVQIFNANETVLKC